MTNFTINTSKQLAAASISIPLTDNIQLTYKALAKYANFSNKSFSCYPKYQTLADQVGFDRTTVIKHVKQLVAIGVLRKADNYYICPRTGQRRQTSNTYEFQLDVIHHFCDEFARGVRRIYRFVKGVLTEKVKIKSPLSCTTAKQVIEKQINIRSSDKSDPIANDSKMIERLVKAEQFSDPKKAFKNRGKRWFCNDDGGLYIHKRYIGQPKGLIGFVKGSVAHQLALETVAMWRDYEDYIKNGGTDAEFV